MPVINPVILQIYAPKADADEHRFRHRFNTRETEFELWKTLGGQPHLFSDHALRRRQELGYLRSLGYVRVRLQDVVAAGISLERDEWVMLQLSLPSLGTARYDILEARPKCPLDGSWLYLDLHFEESVPHENLGTQETTREILPAWETYREITTEDA